MGVAARAGKATHVRQHLDAHLAEHAGEHLPLARGMADGPEGADHVAHAHSVRPTQWTPRRRLKQRTWPGPGPAGQDRKSGGEGKGGSVGVEVGGRRIIKKKKKYIH